MATILSKIFPEDIAIYIYTIALLEYAQNQIATYTYNIYLIAEKHMRMFSKYGYVLLAMPPQLEHDIGIILRSLTRINNKLIIPYSKFGVDYSLDFKNMFNIWIKQLYVLFENQEQMHPWSHFMFTFLKMEVATIRNLIK